MAESKTRLLSLTELEARILMGIIRSSNPSINEQQDVVNIAIKLQKVIDG